jgi:Flp pilus assembly protein TadG
MMNLVKRFMGREHGVSGVEFALMAPVFLILLVAAVDFGTSIYERTRIEDAAQASMTYAMGRGQSLDTSKNAETAQNLERILRARLGDGILSSVDVNNGAKRSYNGTQSTPTGTAAQGGLCYCPSLGSGGVNWGTSVACQASCPGGGTSGKFAFISISKPFSPVFGFFGAGENGYLKLQTIGRIE